ncbi:MAG: Fur family transcriptional regulator [Candidatus Aminicenantaceae bacterium]
MITNMELIKNELERNNIKPTFIRLKMLDYLESNKEHPTAEKIFKILKKEIPTISRTSVYNTLNLFIKKGLLNGLFVNGHETRFDINVYPHYHFFCKKCGKIIDLDLKCEQIKKGYLGGHKITEWHGYFKGICKDCLKKEKE